MKVGDLYVALGIRKDGSWAQSTSWISGLVRAAAGLGAVFGGAKLLKDGFAFNSMLQDAKVRVAEMMAIARKSTLAEQYQEATKAVNELNELATKLPGETEDYVKAFSLISGPILKAKNSMSDLRDITVSTLAFAKLSAREHGTVLDVPTAAREVQRAIDGTSRATDRVIINMLDVAGVTMKQFKHMTALQREQILNSEKIRFRTKEYNDEQQKTFSGQKEQLKDTARKLLARAEEKLFEKVSGWLEKINKWFDANRGKIEAFADSVGSALVKVAEWMGKAFKWLVDHPDLIKNTLKVIAVIIGGVLLRNTILFVRAWGPLYLAITAIVKVFESLQEEIGTTGAALVTAFAVGGLLLYMGKLREIAGLMGLIRGGANGGAGGAGGLPLLPLAAGAAGADLLSSTHKSLSTNDPTALASSINDYVPFARQLGGGDLEDKIGAKNSAHAEDFNRRMLKASQGQYDYRNTSSDDSLGSNTLGEQMKILAAYTEALKAKTAGNITNHVEIKVATTKEAMDMYSKITSDQNDGDRRHATSNLPGSDDED